MAQHGPGSQRRPHTAPRGGIASHITIWGGLSHGLGRFVLAYIIMFVFFLVEMGSSGGTLGGGSGLALVVLPLSFLFSSHLGATAMGFGGAGAFLQIPVYVYYLVPVVLLVWSGYVLARQVDAPSAGARVAAGASVTVGYLAGVVLTIVLLSTLPGSGTAQYSRQLTQLVVVAGIAYPLAFGGAGGALAHVRADDPRGPPVAGGRPPAGGGPGGHAGGRHPNGAPGQDRQPRRTQGVQHQGGQHQEGHSGDRPQQGGQQASRHPGEQHRGGHHQQGQSGRGQHRGGRQPGQAGEGEEHEPTCPECGAAIEPSGDYCRHCGAAF